MTTITLEMDEETARLVYETLQREVVKMDHGDACTYCPLLKQVTAFLNLEILKAEHPIHVGGPAMDMP